MSRLHVPSRAYQLTRTFAEIGLGAVVGVLSLITAGILVVTWFFI